MKYNAFFVVSLLLISAPVVYGQTTTPTATATTSKATSSATTTPSATPIENTPPATQTREAFEDAAQERVINLAANMSNRFDAIIFRLTNISDRLNQRITKLEAAGQDLSIARSYLATARTSLELASANMEDIDVLVFDFATANDPAAQWPEVKSRYIETRDLVRSAYADLRAAIAATRNPAPSEAAQPIADGVE